MTQHAERIVIGRIATLAGDRGYGWVEAIAVAGGGIVAAGRRADVEGLADRRTIRSVLAPDAVLLPALTDAHLHLADTALLASRVDLSTASTLALGLERIHAAHLALADPTAWLEGSGWDAERWGGWPDRDGLDRVAPGRAVALWAHDHHALWASGPALTAAGIDETRPDPPGGAIRRGAGGTPTGVLHEAAASLVADLAPPPTTAQLERAVEDLAGRLVSAGLAAIHDPGMMTADPELALAHAAYAALASSGRLPIRVHASIRADALPAAARRGIRSGDPLGDPKGRARVGWLKLFADGTLGSRTAALLAPYEREPDRPSPPAGDRGTWLTQPERLAALASEAAAMGIATQIHAIGDAAVRAALDALAPVAGRTALLPRVEHAQLVQPADVRRFAEAGVVASVQPVHLRSDVTTARRAWGQRAEVDGYRWRSLIEAGAVLVSGTDAPVEPWDPWPGLEIAVTRGPVEGPASHPGPAPHPGPASHPLRLDESLDLATALRTATVGPAIAAGEDARRGRLVPGMRADAVAVPANVLAEPAEPGGALGRCRPSAVMIDGEVVRGALG